MKSKTKQELYESLGLLYGDGCLKGKVEFSNCNPELVKKIFNFIKSFGINTDKIKTYIKTYRSVSEITDEEILHYWLKYLKGAKRKNFYKIQRRKRVTQNIRKRKLPPKQGLAEIMVYNKQLCRKMNLLMKNAQKDVLKDKIKAIFFLRGIIAAEGSVKLVKEKLKEVRISSCKPKEQEYIRNVLKVVGLIPCKARYDYYIAISGIKQFEILEKNAFISLELFFHRLTK